MKKTFFTCLSVFLVLTLQGQDLGAIMQEHHDAIGSETWQKINTMKMTGTASMQGMEFPITVYASRPNLEKVVIDFQGMQIIQAYDGKTAWNVNPFEGRPDPTISDEATQKEAKHKRFEDDLINYKDKGHSIELAGTEDFNGKPAYKLNMTKASGLDVVYYIDTETYLTVGLVAKTESGPMLGQMVETVMSDYQEVDGIPIPMTYTHKANGQVFLESKMDDVILNIDLKEGIFAIPAEE